MVGRCARARRSRRRRLCPVPARAAGGQSTRARGCLSRPGAGHRAGVHRRRPGVDGAEVLREGHVRAVRRGHRASVRGRPGVDRGEVLRARRRARALTCSSWLPKRPSRPSRATDACTSIPGATSGTTPSPTSSPRSMHNAPSRGTASSSRCARTPGVSSGIPAASTTRWRRRSTRSSPHPSSTATSSFTPRSSPTPSPIPGWRR